MITVFDRRQRAHDPQFFLSFGAPQPCPGKPARADVLLAATARPGLPCEAPPDRGEDAIRAVHPQRYLTFLQDIHARWRRIEGASAEVIRTWRPCYKPFSSPSAPARPAV